LAAYTVALHVIVFLTAFGFAVGVVVVAVVFVVEVFVVVVAESSPLAACVRLATPSAVATPAHATSAGRSERLNRCT
jgi:hypothetical protein